jgi:hypothetical protein
MQLRRTISRLSALLLSGCLASSLTFATEPPSILSSDDQGRYMQELKRTYQTQNEREALFAHSNQLLKTYALKAGYQVGQAKREDLTYQLRQGEAGELVLREEKRDQQNHSMSVSNRVVPLFGVDPFVRYECPNTGITCTLRTPGDGSSTLLTIVRDHKGASELAKALSYLIRNLQKG